MTECYFCTATENIEQHHIVPRRFSGHDEQSNIVSLCHDCHWKLERLYNKDFWEAIGIDDPRATKESHMICEFKGCTNPASEPHILVGDTGRERVYRCDEHHPEKVKAEMKKSEEWELRSTSKTPEQTPGGFSEEEINLSIASALDDM